MSRMSIEEHKKEFVKIFKELAYSRSSWEVWSDVITVIAITISNAVDRSSPRWEEREHEYMQLIKRLGGNEKPAKIFAEIVGALEDDPDQDFLGQLYMQLELGNHWKGQFFTPYNISSMMAQMSLSGAQNEIENKGWISICDPCVGGGAMLIAARNIFARNNINFSNHVLFVGQDIDRVVGLMAYIQIALLGCPGYIVIGDSLTNPMVGSALEPTENEGQEFWFTPIYCSATWNTRRFIAALNRTEKMRSKEKIEKKDFYFFFELKKEESING